MPERDALQDRLETLKATQEAGFEPTEAGVASVLRRGKRRRVASFAGAGIGAVAIVALVWTLAFSPTPTAPDIPPAFGHNEPRVSAGIDIRSGDVTFRGAAAQCGESWPDSDLEGPYCFVSLSFSNESGHEILLRPEDNYLVVDGVRYEIVNDQDENWEDFNGPNVFFEEPLWTRPGGGSSALFIGLPQELHFPLELHLRVPGGEAVVIEYPECAVIIPPDHSASVPCD